MKPHENKPFVRALLLVALATGCGRLSSDPDAPVPPTPLDPLPGAHATLGLVSAAGGNGSVAVQWRVPKDKELLPARLGVFVSTDPDALQNAEPFEVDEASGQARFGGLPADSLLYARLAARNDSGANWNELGATLAFHTGEPLYVDPLTTLATGDGLTPETPFQDITLALIFAPVLGKSVIWVAEGSQPVAQLPLVTGLHMVGGFTTSFSLADRDTEAHPTRLLAIDDPGTPNDPALVVLGPGAVGVPATLDGFELEGLASTTVGLDSSGHQYQARDVHITGCVRGFRLRSLPTDNETEIVVTGCSARNAVNEGLSVDGSFDLLVEASDFDNNGAEGAAIGKLYASSARSVALRVRGCRFTRNGQEGLDIQLGVPTGAVAPGGRFVVELEESDFLDNQLDGVRVDLDYETAPEWSARIVARGLSAHTNGLAGVHFDLDASSSALAHRLACRANGTDGFLVTSESWSGIATLSSSALWGNLGAGARATFGNVAVVASHCAFAGNVQGGFVADTSRSVALNCAADSQSNPWSGVNAVASLSATGHEPAWFAHAPLEYATVISINAASLQTEAATNAGVGSTMEVGDDGEARLVVSAAGPVLALAPAPAAQGTPVRAWFWADSNVTEDWRAAPAGELQGSGWTGPDSQAQDCGPFGAPQGGVPGRDEPVPPTLFYLASATPSISSSIPPAADLVLEFAGGAPDRTTLAQGLVVRRGQGLLTLGFTVNLGSITAHAPVGGWLDGDRLELHAALHNSDGHPLATPFTLVLDAQ